MDHSFRAGDILACYGTCAVSRLISFGTASLFAPAGLRIGPSHVAMIVGHEGRLRWAESTTLSTRPCLIQGRPVHGWQLHEIDDRLDDYRDAAGRVDLYRLHPFYAFDLYELVEFARWATDYWINHRAHYDTRSALWSGSRIVRRFKLYKPADLAAVFCSEYIAAVLRRMGRLAGDENPGRFNPATLLRELVQAGTYQRVRSIHPLYTERHPRLRLYQPAA